MGHMRSSDKEQNGAAVRIENLESRSERLWLLTRFPFMCGRENSSRYWDPAAPERQRRS